jgi:ribose/xylose/arabinose/galactoside ABC-type transport system permease subunit
MLMEMEIVRKKQHLDVRYFIVSQGFVIAMVLCFIVFSIIARNFMTLKNMVRILHAEAPLLILVPGLAMVIMAGKIDISVGSIAFLSSGIGVLLLTHYNIPSYVVFPLIVVIGFILGALNGLLVVVLKITPFIATMGTMFMLRGVALQLTNSMVLSIPKELQRLGYASVGTIYIDVIIAAIVLLLAYFIHVRTPFGRHIMAIGNEANVAEQLGVKVPKITFLAFVLSGLFASLGGIFVLFQVGAVTPTMGQGYEFNAIALCIIGGISLFGGEGSILPGLLLGGITIGVIENGLNMVGASPYAYPFVKGGVIFIAMYADSIKRVLRKTKIAIPEEPFTTTVGLDHKKSSVRSNK